MIPLKFLLCNYLFSCMINGTDVLLYMCGISLSQGFLSLTYIHFKIVCTSHEISNGFSDQYQDLCKIGFDSQSANRTSQCVDTPPN